MKHMFNGKALVITGPQGSGKTLLARAIAQAIGETVNQISQPNYGELSRFGLGYIVKADTVIIDVERPMESDEMARFKSLISSPKIEINVRGQECEIVDSPNFIFCTGDPDFIPLNQDDRRFWVISIDGFSPLTNGS